jgi:arginine deiminase
MSAKNENQTIIENNLKSNEQEDEEQTVKEPATSANQLNEISHVDEVFRFDDSSSSAIKSDTGENQSKIDIFHLTETNDQQKSADNQQETDQNYIESQKTTDLIEQPDHNQSMNLRNILITNYDPKFASKIGVKEFVPIQIICKSIEGNDDTIEFIPFEKIESSYPK